MKLWTIRFDGLCEPANPGGWMCWGYIAIAPDGSRREGMGSVPPHPSNTNNNAEWHALGHALRAVSELGGTPAPLVIEGDSQLVVHQFNGKWACNKDLHRAYRDRCRELANAIARGQTTEARWIPREQNEEADSLTRAAYVEATGKQPPERSRRKAG